MRAAPQITTFWIRSTDFLGVVVKITHVLDALGALALIGFAFLIWPPLALAVFGVLALALSWLRARGGRS